MDRISETLQDSEDQIAELQTLAASFENSVVDFNEELICLSSQKE